MAICTWVGSVGNSNWGTTTNWLLGIVPTAFDDVVISASPLNGITLDTTARVCKTIDFTNFGSNTLTMTNSLTVAGSVTLIAAMVIAGTSSLIIRNNDRKDKLKRINESCMNIDLR
jgi:hypothetical protein